jgi:hypothetical protein
MTKQAKFYNLPTDQVPLNRRVYKAAKAPFASAWVFVSCVLMPWLEAAPWAIVSGSFVTWLASDAAMSKADLFYECVGVSVVWTGVLGAVWAIVKGLKYLSK